MIDTSMHTTDSGLTAAKAAYVEQARQAGQIFIAQRYALYTAANHDAWRRLHARMSPRWSEHACPEFLDGLTSIALAADAIPRFSDVNRLLAARTGFEVVAVSGYVPTGVFFASLAERRFPATVTIRDSARLDYLPEPDVFHDIAGHVPMHADAAFADVLARLGVCGVRVANHIDRAENAARRAELDAALQALARFFWFTIEFGLVRERGTDRLKAYGSGLLSSYAELAHAVRAADVDRQPFDLDTVIRQHFEIDSLQPTLFVIDDFSHLRHLVGALEEWLDGLLGRIAGMGDAA